MEVHHEPNVKIMVMATALRNQPRFTGKRTLVLTGERADESPKRAAYRVFQTHPANSRAKPMDVWRPVHRWTKREVWALIEKFRVAVHPGYRLGWGRLSCAACIFGSPDQWASLRTVNPRQFQRIGAYEREFNYTINMKGKTILQMADEGRPFLGMRDEDIRAALSPTFDEPVFVAHWTLPAGAHGDACGPT
jgi:3'-phosphoadenosine 5'-phosphosulfate sulfotransferase (PAPS reductase)/FAD synthetase